MTEHPNLRELGLQVQRRPGAVVKVPAIRRSVPFGIALSLFALSCAAAPDAAPPVAGDLEALKLAYLRCDRHAAETLFSFSEAAECSLIYEELKKRAFGGDYGRLLAWWRDKRLRATEDMAANR